MSRNDALSEIVKIVKQGGNNINSQLCTMALEELEKGYSKIKVSELFEQAEKRTNYDMSEVLFLIKLQT